MVQHKISWIMANSLQNIALGDSDIDYLWEDLCPIEQGDINESAHQR